jgi:DNA-binding GntR family transcriptional regulator
MMISFNATSQASLEPDWIMRLDIWQDAQNTAFIIMNARIDANLTSTDALAAPALYSRVAELLRKRIFAHELSPGSWVDEQALATEFGISRTPMREALKVLASEGLVVLRPRRGCYVAELSERDLDEVFPVMAMLEAKAAEEAARRLTDDDIARLQAIHDDLERYASTDADRFFDANQRFHTAVQELSGNGYLRQLIEETRKVIKLTRRDSLRLAGRISQSLDEHRGILEALRARDAALAGKRMHQHLLSGRAAIARLAEGA